MIERILTVGGFTLLSRLTGFARDIMLAAFLGADWLTLMEAAGLLGDRVEEVEADEAF